MKIVFISAVLGLCVALPGVSRSAEPLSTFEDKISYSIGFKMGTDIKKNVGDEIRKEMLIKGIEDAYAGTEQLMTDQEIQAIMQEFGMKMQAKQMAKIEEMKAKNKDEGTSFLEENKKKEGVIVTESGLQYKVLKEGEGEKAKPTDEVTVEYVGTLLDGTEFDSTIARGEPATFRADGVIKGWSEALQLMSVGSKLHLVIPSELAYGENGAAPQIEPNSVLVFDVELKSIKGTTE